MCKIKVVKYIFICSFILKISVALIAFIVKDSTLYSDEIYYDEYAVKIMNQGVWEFDPSVRYDGLVGPIFPMLLAFLYSLFGHNNLSIYLLNAIAGGGLTILAYYLSRLAFNEKVGLYASCWTIIYGLYYVYLPRALKEMLVFFTFALIIYLILSDVKERKITLKFILLPFLYSIFIHLDERYLFYLPFLIVFFFIVNKHHRKIAFKKSVVFVFTVILLMIPWTVRNYQVYGKIVVLTTRTLRTDIIANKFSKNRLLNETESSHHFLSAVQIDSIAKGLKTYGRHPLEIERIKKGIMPRKYSIWERWYYEFIEFWTPTRFKPGYSGNGFRFRERSLFENLGMLFTYGIILPFFIVGIILSIRRKNVYGIVLIAIVFLHTFLHVFLLWSVHRYRVPIDLFVIILAAFGFEDVYGKIRKFNTLRAQEFQV